MRQRFRADGVLVSEGNSAARPPTPITTTITTTNAGLQCPRGEWAM